MEIKQALIDATKETMSMFGMNIDFEQKIDDYNISENHIKVHIKLLKGYDADFVLSLDEEVAKNIVSSMMGGMQITQIDDMAHSALGELLNMTAGAALCKFNSSQLIDLSTPKVIDDYEVFNQCEYRVNYMFNLGNNKYNIGIFK